MIKRFSFVVVILAASAAMATAALPKLPGPIAFPQSGDSPGVVTFNHETHVDAAKPSCTGCHPAQFAILKATPKPTMKHEQMQKGSQCGACHDGKKAFAFDADCTMCHKAQ